MWRAKHGEDRGEVWSGGGIMTKQKTQSQQTKGVDLVHCFMWVLCVLTLGLPAKTCVFFFLCGLCKVLSVLTWGRGSSHSCWSRCSSPGNWPPCTAGAGTLHLSCWWLRGTNCNQRGRKDNTIMRHRNKQTNTNLVCSLTQNEVWLTTGFPEAWRGRFAPQQGSCSGPVRPFWCSPDTRWSVAVAGDLSRPWWETFEVYPPRQTEL